jgi:hypothetical protein
MRKPRTPSWTPANYELADIEAIKAVFDGKGDPAQQRRALDWVVNAAAETYELSFRSNSDGGDRETAFAEGKRHVGMQLVKMINMPPALVAKLRSKNA